jgi:hypothetical protein
MLDPPDSKEYVCEFESSSPASKGLNSIINVTLTSYSPQTLIV